MLPETATEKTCRNCGHMWIDPPRTARLCPKCVARATLSTKSPQQRENEKN